jgi:hypothetical protein
VRGLALLALGLPAFGQAELQVTFGVLQKMVASQVFTEDGRRWVKGGPEKRCSFAYLENPRVGEWEGRLVVRTKFSGRSALNVLGKCVGMGDSFDVVVRMTPYVEKTVLRFREVEVGSDGKRGIYARRVCEALGKALPGVLAYDFGPEFKKALEAEQAGVPFRKVLREMAVQDLRVERDALVLRLGLKMRLE